MKKLTNYVRLISVLIVGLISLILQFALNMPVYAQVVISVMGSLIALLMFIDMVKTLRSGKFGVDLLAITAVIATIAVGEYWAALIVLLMLTGGDALEDYAPIRPIPNYNRSLKTHPNQLIWCKVKRSATFKSIR